ncbi:DNA-nicking Smr family endonuclease [Natronospira proteinivora]|uniref:DNA-nicking Smr family endonuclease n=1 Tax=Natronospira proteinivora TaxID=1807133 RepID=A0ABT1G5V0_9GAMM|nr:Smr/MutS family protein [Natronospira proteinivora]MCP1726646.1 DNA-nicking Smr family endonuclease [Natronospira proteinivora]
MAKRKTPLSEDEIALFRESVGDIKPIRDDAAEIEAPRPPAKARFRRRDDAAVLDESLNGDWDQPLETGEELRFARAGLRDDILKRLHKGRIPVKDELDLHGMNWKEARECVAYFLADCRELDINCVRIVHGKGLRSGNTGPVLKSKLNSWLRKREDVLAFCSARPDDGGTGAAYILLATRS